MMGKPRILSQNEYQTLFDASGTAMILVEEDMTISLVNGEFEKLSGFSKEEIENKLPWTKFVHEDDLKKMIKNHEDRRSGKENIPQKYEFKFVDKEGNIKDIMVKVTLLPGTKISLGSLIDISDLKNEQRKSRQTQKLMRKMFDGSKDGKYISDLDGKIIRMNRSAFELLGFSEHEIGTINARDLYYDPKDRQEFVNLISTKGSVKDFEVKLRTKDGRKIDCLVTSNITKDTEEGRSEIHGTIRDITETKMSATRVMESEKKYRTLFENNVFGIYRTNPEGEILAANDTLVKMLGFDSFEELAMRNLNSEGYRFDHDRQEFRRMMEERSEVIGFSTIWEKKDGSLIYVKENSRAIKDENGRILYYDGTVEDLSKQILAEERARLGKAYLEGLFNVALEGIVLVDSDGKVTQVNDEFLRMFGFSKDDLIDKKLDDQISSNYRKEESEVITGAVLMGETQTIDTKRKKKDGKEIHVSIIASPIFMDGKMIGAFGIYRDISERIEHEHSISKLNETLKEITSILSHDIMNNLMIIMQASELLKITKNMDKIDMINYGVERSINIIKRMKEFESVYTEEKELKRYQIDHVIRDVMKGLNIPFEINGEPHFEVDSEFFSVVHNLVINSIKHGRTKRMEFKIYDNNGHYVLEVIDFGIGMDDKVKKMIFEQGYSHGENKGTGFGLALVKTMITRNKGTIAVLDNEPNGSIFRITLPK